MSVDRATLAPLPLFNGFSPALIETLARRGVEMVFPAGTVIFLEGAEPRGWYIVLDGQVKVVRGSGSRQHVVHTERTGGTLGEVPVFAGTTHPATGIAADTTRVAVFDRASLLAAIAECPEIGFLINRRLALRVKALVNRLDERSRGMRARIAEYLLERAKTARRSQLVSLGMTQHALAEELATVREVISREMRALVRAGVIAQRGGGRYELLNLEELRRRAEESR